MVILYGSLGVAGYVCLHRRTCELLNTTEETIGCAQVISCRAHLSGSCNYFSRSNLRTPESGLPSELYNNFKPFISSINYLFEHMADVWDEAILNRTDCFKDDMPFYVRIAVIIPTFGFIFIVVVSISFNAHNNIN